MYTLPVFLVAFLASVATIVCVKPLAVYVGLVDKPGGHKAHDNHVPLVGGVAIFVSLSLAWFLAPRLGLSSINSVFAAAGGLLFMVGLVDDRRPLSVRLRFAVQIIAASLLIYSNVVIVDLGYLLGDTPFALHWLAVPVTIIATVGAINALNMIDGMDGLAGSVSWVSFMLLTIVAFSSSNLLQILILLCVLGGLSGFLAFNMPLPGRARAHIFMGDAGSTLLGFLLANSLIVLSQGEYRAMAPVTAVWIFAVPLLDTLGVMLRRVWLGKSPFSADRGHIHHLLLDAGFRVRHAVLLIALLQTVLGGVGLFIDYVNAPELLSLALFGVLFCGYAYLISRPWRAVPIMRGFQQSSGWTTHGVEHIYVGGLHPTSAIADMHLLLGARAATVGFELYRSGDASDAPVYALVNIGDADKVGEIMAMLKWRLSRHQRAGHAGLTRVSALRQFIPRQVTHDRRSSVGKITKTVTDSCKRDSDRRKVLPRLIYRSEEWLSSKDSGDGLQAL
jgi:UDP-GlcNAc:undecaprenyl-phosphate GlcNAc-1-phosphate transferase